MGNAIRWTPEALAEYQRRTQRLETAGPVAQKVEKVAKRSKYASKKVTDADGTVHDSGKEARRWNVLRELEKVGEISDLKRQVKFELIPKQRRSDGAAERACAYVSDFMYVRGGVTVVEDSKGFKTKDYIIKRKLMLHVHGITVIEV